MVRTDRRGRAFKTFLIAEIVGSDITVEELRQAIGVKRSRWYGDGTPGSGRSEADDFPDPNELRSLSEHYKLGDDGWLNLLVEFGWMRPRPDAPGFTRPTPATGKGVTTATTAARPKPTVDWHHRGPSI